MAKLNVDEFNKKWSEKITDDDLIIELMEDASDSISVDESEELKKLNDEIIEAQARYEKVEKELFELKQRYKDRFLTSISDEEKEDDEESSDELEEKEIIDVKEI